MATGGERTVQLGGVTASQGPSAEGLAHQVTHSRSAGTGCRRSCDCLSPATYMLMSEP